MSINDSFDSPRFGAECAKIIAMMWSDNGTEAARATAFDQWGTCQRGFFQPVSDGAPPFMILEYPNCVVTLIGGAMRLIHIRQFLAGIQLSVTSNNAAPFNRSAWTVGQTILAVMDSEGFTKSKVQVTAGHSYGGVIAEAVSLAQFNGGSMWGQVQCVTFGSPKPGTEYSANLARTMQLQRWMSVGDPVPRIFPERGESVAIVVTAPIGLQMAGYESCQWHGGTLISNNLQLTAANLPPLQQNNIDASLLAWWWRVSGDTSHAHHAASYYAKLTLIANAQVVPVNGHPPATNVFDTPAPRPTLSDLRDNVRNYETQYVDAPDAEPSHGAAPAFKFFRYAKEGGMYVVYFMENEVCRYAKKGKAKKMVSGGNKMAANYLRSPLGSSDQFAAAMQVFLDSMDAGDFNV